MQRFYITSISRAKRVAKSLRVLFDRQLDRDLSLTQAQHVIARMLGYDSHAELKRVTDQGAHDPSPFDELLSRESLDVRLKDQSSALALELDVSPHTASEIVALLRLTAHPSGPHHLAGPSSEIGAESVEFRGYEWGVLFPFLLRNGVLQTFMLVSQDIPALQKLHDRAEQSIMKNTDTAIFMQVEDIPAGPAPSADAVGDRHLSGDGNKPSKFSEIRKMKEGPPTFEYPESTSPIIPRDAYLAPKIRQAAPAARRSIRECIEAADIHVFPLEDGFEIAARFPLPDGSMLGSLCQVSGKRTFPVPDTDSFQIEDATPEEVVTGNVRTIAGPYNMAFDRFESALRNCGLHATGHDPFALSKWRRLLAESGDVADLETLNDIWGERVVKAGIENLRRRIDGEVIDLLDLATYNLLRDDHAYRYTRDLPSNAGCRAVLATYPMLFAEIWSSPEIVEDMSVARIEKALLETGLSCQGMGYGTAHGIPAIPTWLVGWLRGRRFASDAMAEDGVCKAIGLLCKLGERYLPETEEDWQSLVELAECLNYTFDSESPWERAIPDEAWKKLLLGADTGWVGYVTSLKHSLQPGTNLYKSISYGFGYSVRQDCGLDPDDNEFPEPGPDRDRMIAAFADVPLLDRLADGPEWPRPGH